jgi:hypothetical protein
LNVWKPSGFAAVLRAIERDVLSCAKRRSLKPLARAHGTVGGLDVDGAVLRPASPNFRSLAEKI